MIKQRDQDLRVALQSRLAHNKTHFQELRNKVIEQLREGKADFFIAIIDDAKGNSKFIWDNINKITKREDKSIQN